MATSDPVPEASPPAGEDVASAASPGLDQAALDLVGRAALHHWQQATVTDSSLDVRDNVFFAAVEMTRMPMILADPRRPDCPIAFANNAFLDLTGYEKEEVMGRNCRFLQGAGTDTESVREMREALARRHPVALEILNYRRDGTPFWNAIFIGPVFDQAGELIYFFASQLDVSKRREGEQSLRHAQKMEAIGQLTAGLAHDFNNLLQIVNGSLERLQLKRDGDTAFERHHAAAVSATARGAKLTQQLLAFARRTRLDPQEVDLSQLVHSFAELLETSVGQKAELHLSLQRRLPPVRVDASHLEMALLNIVINARDASLDGGAIVVTTKIARLNGNAAAHHLDPGDYVLLSVTDQGVGMPPHVQARATEPFFTTKEPGHGTGLGLAMAHGFAQQSGGRLEIDSEPGRGTTIRMLFPAVGHDASAVEHGAKPTGYQAQPLEDPATPPLILVVDDSLEIADFARDALTDIGYRVVLAHSAEDAFALFAQAKANGDPFDLVFSDMLMPGGANGLVLAERVHNGSPETPVLLTTGYNDDMSQDGPKASTMDVLGKPYKRSELLDRVQAALRRGARSGPGRRTSDFGHVTG